MLNASVCAFVCTQGTKFGRFSIIVGGLVPGPRGKGQRGVKYSLRAGESSDTTVIASVFCLAKSRLWDPWDAFVRLSRRHEARQTGALVRSLCVGALPILTQGHLVAYILTLIYVCGKKIQEVKQQEGFTAETSAPSPHLLLSGLRGMRG